ncbi:MAG: hypothetical protein HOW73_48500 [Polyangiaceae bacterium]|nr:hypothetical protein [Polyangiaceae bacterium]
MARSKAWLAFVAATAACGGGPAASSPAQAETAQATAAAPTAESTSSQAYPQTIALLSNEALEARAAKLRKAMPEHGHFRLHATGKLAEIRLLFTDSLAETVDNRFDDKEAAFYKKLVCDNPDFFVVPCPPPFTQSEGRLYVLGDTKERLLALHENKNFTVKDVDGVYIRGAAVASFSVPPPKIPKEQAAKPLVGIPITYEWYGHGPPCDPRPGHPHDCQGRSPPTIPPERRRTTADDVVVAEQVAFVCKDAETVELRRLWVPALAAKPPKPPPSAGQWGWTPSLRVAPGALAKQVALDAITGEDLTGRAMASTEYDLPPGLCAPKPASPKAK